MVLNFFQLRNHTQQSFDIRNTDNPSDDYVVGPNDTSSRHDMWLCQCSGERSVTIYSYSYGCPLQPFLQMWDQNWAIRYRVGGSPDTHSIAVNGNKDFYIDAYSDHFVIQCYDGNFAGSTDQVRVNYSHF